MMAASSSSSGRTSPHLVSKSNTCFYDSLDYAFDKLRSKLQEKQIMLQNHKQSRTRKPFSRSGRDHSSAVKEEVTRYDILGSEIELLETDCMFLRTFLACIPFCCYCIKTDDEAVRNFESLIIKIKDVMTEIAQVLDAACDLNYVSSSLMKVQLLKPEIEEALHHCSIDTSKIELPSSLSWPDDLFHFWKEFFNTWTTACMEGICNERGVDPDLQQQLHAFRCRLCDFGQYWEEMEPDSEARTSLPLHIIDNFWCHYARLAIRIAHQSCLYWFAPQLDLEARSTILIGLLDLQQLIDPTTPEFLELNLGLLRAFNKTSSLLVMGQVHGFLDYVWNERTDTLVKLQLEMVIAFLVNIPEESSEDLESFSTGIKAVFRDLGFFIKPFLGTNNWEHLPEFRSVREKVWLLNAEITLQDPIDVIKNLRKDEYYPIHLSEKKYGKRICALSEEMVRELSSLSSSYRAGKISSDAARKSLLVLLLKVVLYKVDSFCAEMLNGNPSLMHLWSDQNEALNLLIKFIKDQREENIDYVEHIYRQIKTAARQVISLCHSYSTSKITEEMMEKMSLLFSDLLAKIKLEKLAK